MKPNFERGVEVVVASFIVNARGEVLLVRSPKWRRDQWLFPGGHVEFGETLFDAAKREAKEETGLVVEPRRYLQVGERIDDPNFHRPAHLVYFHVLCEAKTSDLTLDPAEIVEARWYQPEDALRLPVSGRAKRSIERFRNGYTVPFSDAKWLG